MADLPWYNTVAGVQANYWGILLYERFTMKKFIFLPIVCMLLYTGCSMDMYEEGLKSGGSSETEELKGQISAENFNTDGEPLCREDDVEEDINAESISQDCSLTEQAEEFDITEYCVLIDGIDRKVLPEKDAGGKSYEILEAYNTRIPHGIDVNLIYDRYNVAFDYAVALTDNINIRSIPNVSAAVIGKAHSLEKLNLIAKIKGQFLDSYGSDIWLQIAWNDIDTVKTGYVFGTLVDTRSINFTAMIEHIDKLKKEIESNMTAYIANYKDRNGKPPLYEGKKEDGFGTSGYQSAPAYESASSDSSFRYVPDGMLVSILGETESFYRVRIPAYNDEYYVPKVYVSARKSIEELKQVVVIDQGNQNEAVFQYFDGKWQIVSYTYATTGGDSKYRQPTEKGYFMAIQKRESFEYTNGNSGVVAGYAPYAVRFSRGAYINGIPVEYEEKEGQKKDPGMIEYLFTLGTFPRSHRCVRNYTSHAKFLYEWLVIGESAVVVMD